MFMHEGVLQMHSIFHIKIIKQMGTMYDKLTSFLLNMHHIRGRHADWGFELK